MKTRLLLAALMLLLTISNGFTQEINPNFKAPKTWVTDECGTLWMLPTFDYNEFLYYGGYAYSDCGIVENSLNSYFNTYYDELYKKILIETVYEIEDSCGNTMQCFNHYFYRPSVYIPQDVNVVHPLNDIEEIDSLTGLPFSNYYTPITTEQFIDAGGYLTENCGSEYPELNYYDWVMQYDENGLPESFIRTFEVFDPMNGLFYNMNQYIDLNSSYPVPNSITIMPPYWPDDLCYTLYSIPYIYDYQSFNDLGGIILSDCEINVNSFQAYTGSYFYDEFWGEFIDERYYYVEDYCGNFGEYFDANFLETPIIAPADLYNTSTCLFFNEIEQLTGLPYSNNFSEITNEQFIAAGGIIKPVCDQAVYFIEYIDDPVYPGTCPLSFTRTFFVNGFDYETDQLIVFEDIEPPTLTAPNDTVLTCLDQVPYPFADFTEFEQAGGTASDNCILMEHSFRLLNESIDGACPQTIIRTYEIQDTCGNQATASQYFTIIDTMVPIMTGIPITEVACIRDVPMEFRTYEDFIAAGGAITDDCGLDESTFSFVGSTTTGACMKEITREYQIKDWCENTGTFIQKIYVSDTIPPAFLTQPQTIADIEYGSEFPPFETLEFTDNCGIPELTTSVLPYVDDENGYEVTYLWTLTDSCGNTSETSASFNVFPKPIEYCPSSGNSGSEWIQSVTIGSQTNTSGADSYNDYTGTVVFNLESTATYTITLTPDFSAKATFEYWAVWIDYNLDGIFSDNEKVFSADKKRSTVSGTIIIPDMESVETRMRVSISRDGSPSSCGDIGNGEVEDYKVIIGSAVPKAPVAVFSSDKTTVNIGESVQFYDESLYNPTWWEWSMEGADIVVSSEQNPIATYSSTGTYGVFLTVANAVGTDSIYLADYITVNDPSVSNYCESYSLSFSKEWIAEVIFGDINNASAGSVYSDFTSIGTTLTAGSNGTITLTPGFSGKSQREYFKVWIDFNQDKNFDANEEVFSIANAKSSVSGNIQIPLDALIGTTRMRISMKANSFAGSCEVFDRGEVEDYSITIADPAKSASLSPAENSDEKSFHIYPNPTQSMLNIQYDTFDPVEVKVYNTSGALVMVKKFDSEIKQLDVNKLSNGVYYLELKHADKTFRTKFIKHY